MYNRQFPDYNNCLVNLANSILKKFGAKTTAQTLPVADKYLSGNYKNVVIFLLDALGTSIMEKHLDADGFFRSHFAGSFNSVYPPTTVAATTSLMSGLYPNEHAWLGWDIYYPQLNKTVTVFRNTDQLSEKEGAKPSAKDSSGNPLWTIDSLNKPLPAADFKVGYKFTPYKSIVDKINDAGGKAYFSMPFLPPYPKDLEAIFSRIKKLCDEDGQKFIYSYWNEPDTTMHKTGTTSDATHEMITSLEKRIQELTSTLSDTLFIITADHGHMDSKNLCILDYPEIMNCLKQVPSIESRTLNLFVKDECRKNFPSLFKKNFGDDFLLLTKEEVLEQNVFGPGKNHPGLTGMIGDFIAFSISNTSIFNTHYQAQVEKGNHAGLTPEEISIPLITIEC